MRAWLRWHSPTRGSSSTPRAATTPPSAYAATAPRSFRSPTGPASAQKQRSLDRARGRWVLAIDADERVTPELAASIQRVVAAGDGGPVAYELRACRAYAAAGFVTATGTPTACCVCSCATGTLLRRPGARARNRRGRAGPPRWRASARHHAEPRRRACQDEPLQQRERSPARCRGPARWVGRGDRPCGLGLRPRLCPQTRLSRWRGRLHGGRLCRRRYVLAVHQNRRARTPIANEALTRGVTSQ